MCTGCTNNEFLYYLEKDNFGNMARKVSKDFTKDRTIGKLAGETSLEFENEEDRTPFEIIHQFRFCYEDENVETVTRGYKVAEWKINDSFFIGARIFTCKERFLIYGPI